MSRDFIQRGILKFAMASLICLGGAFCIAAGVSAQDAPGKAPSIEIKTQDGYRYISAYGVPRHVGGQPAQASIKPHAYGLRVTAAPKSASSAKLLKPADVFGIAFDGVPFVHGEQRFWSDNAAWQFKTRGLDPYGGEVREDGAYVYGGIPQKLVSKDLSHVGYAADGFPIFVHKTGKFTPSYRLKEGRRPAAPNGPGGTYDGRYIADYQYVPGLGVLDRCNGVKVKDKYYIYILPETFPRIPLCWSGRPDQSFLNLFQQARTNEDLSVRPGASEIQQESSRRRRRRER